MDIHYLFIFLVTVMGVSLIPGPSTLIAFSHGVSFGWQRSLYTALGNCSASTIQAIVASIGIELLINSSTFLFFAMKYGGAVFLIYFGIKMWRSAVGGVSFDADNLNVNFGRLRLFGSGFSIAMSNPKAIAFFTALFPQFLDPTADSSSKLFAMIFLVCFSAFFVAALYAGLGAYIRTLEFTKRAMSRIYKTTGALFVASGLGLVLSGNR